jgi:YD repeat-containing protein
LTRQGGSATAIGYDAADRMSSLAHSFTPTSGNETWTLTYTPGSELYTSVGSNGAWDWSPTSLGAVAATVNGLNQTATAGGVTQSWDGNGNLTSDGVRAFTYDPENRLTGVTGPQSVSLTYDPTGRLQSETVNGVATSFLYDGDALAAEYDGGGNVLRRYAHGPAVDDPLIWFEGWSLLFSRLSLLCGRTSFHRNENSRCKVR